MACRAAARRRPQRDYREVLPYRHTGSGQLATSTRRTAISLEQQGGAGERRQEGLDLIGCDAVALGSIVDRRPILGEGKPPVAPGLRHGRAERSPVTRAIEQRQHEW